MLPFLMPFDVLSLTQPPSSGRVPGGAEHKWDMNLVGSPERPLRASSQGLVGVTQVALPGGRADCLVVPQFPHYWWLFCSMACGSGWLLWDRVMAAQLNRPC